jgi:FixJ family two-component response regulator
MSTLSSPIVFIVDDDEDMRLSMQRILKTVGLRTKLFATPQDFLQRNIPMLRVAWCWMCAFLEWADSRSSIN